MLKSSVLHTKLLFFSHLFLYQFTSSQFFENLGSPFNYLEDLVKDTTDRFLNLNDANNDDLDSIHSSDELKAEHENSGISDKDLLSKEQSLEKYLAEIEAEDVQIYLETGRRPGDLGPEFFTDPEFPEDKKGYSEFAEFSKLVPKEFLIDDEEDHFWAENLVDNKWENRRMYNDIMREKGDRIIEDRLTFRSGNVNDSDDYSDVQLFTDLVDQVTSLKNNDDESFKFDQNLFKTQNEDDLRASIFGQAAFLKPLNHNNEEKTDEQIQLDFSEEELKNLGINADTMDVNQSGDGPITQEARNKAAKNHAKRKVYGAAYFEEGVLYNTRCEDPKYYSSSMNTWSIRGEVHAVQNDGTSCHGMNHGEKCYFICPWVQRNPGDLPGPRTANGLTQVTCICNKNKCTFAVEDKVKRSHWWRQAAVKRIVQCKHFDFTRDDKVYGFLFKDDSINRNLKNKKYNAKLKAKFTKIALRVRNQQVDFIHNHALSLMDMAEAILTRRGVTFVSATEAPTTTVSTTTTTVATTAAKIVVESEVEETKTTAASKVEEIAPEKVVEISTTPLPDVDEITVPLEPELEEVNEIPEPNDEGISRDDDYFLLDEDIEVTIVNTTQSGAIATEATVGTTSTITTTTTEAATTTEPAGPTRAPWVKPTTIPYDPSQDFKDPVFDGWKKEVFSDEFTSIRRMVDLNPRLKRVRQLILGQKRRLQQKKIAFNQKNTMYYLNYQKFLHTQKMVGWVMKNDKKKKDDELATKYLNYGCWCFHRFDNPMVGYGLPKDDIDRICMQNFLCMKCARMEFGDQCHSSRAYSFRKVVNKKTGEREIFCENNVLDRKNQCRKALCECDRELASKLKDLQDLFDANLSGEWGDFIPEQKCQDFDRKYTQFDKCCGNYPKVRPHSTRGKAGHSCCGREIYNPSDQQCCNDEHAVGMGQECGRVSHPFL